MKKNYQKERKPGIDESGNQRSILQRSGNQSEHQGSRNQSWNQRSGNGAPRQEGSYNLNGRPDNRTPEDKKRDKEGTRVNIVNYNTNLIKHFAQLLEGKIPPEI